ncbi:MAG TPA: hypothetical protein VJ064_02545 [Limnochordia bacterium]|nr:hypothetical protein [Limnochordia bacterium]
MKRTFVFALALVLLLTVGVLAAPPIKRGPQNDSASVPFTINILPYAEVKLDDNKLFHVPSSAELVCIPQTNGKCWLTPRLTLRTS